MTRNASTDPSRFFERPSDFRGANGDQEKKPPEPHPERLAELEVLRGAGGAFAVALDGKTIVINLPAEHTICLCPPEGARRLQLFPMIPRGEHFARSITVRATDDESVNDVEMEHQRSGSGAMTYEEPPAVRILGGLRDLILDQVASDKPSRFRVACELAEVAAKLQGMLAASMQDAAVHPGGAPIFGGNPLAFFGGLGGGLGVPAPPAPGDTDFGNIMRELMMLVQGQNKLNEEKAASAEARMAHSLMMSDIEMIRTMQQNQNSTPELDARLVLLLKRLEADNAGEADKHGPDPVVPPDVPRGHSADSEGGNHASGVGGAH